MAKLDTEEFKSLVGETIKSAVLVDDEKLLLELGSGRKVEIVVGSHTDPAIELTPFLYLQDAK
jgi:hypothetical protein